MDVGGFSGQRVGAKEGGSFIAVLEGSLSPGATLTTWEGHSPAFIGSIWCDLYVPAIIPYVRSTFPSQAALHHAPALSPESAQLWCTLGISVVMDQSSVL